VKKDRVDLSKNQMQRHIGSPLDSSNDCAQLAMALKGKYQTSPRKVYGPVYRIDFGDLIVIRWPQGREQKLRKFYAKLLAACRT